MVTESGPEVAEGNPTMQAGTQEKDIIRRTVKAFSRLSKKEKTIKLENPYIKLFENYPIAKEMATAKYANGLNSMHFPELYSPVLFGSVSLRPFRDMEEVDWESDEEDERGKRKRRRKDNAGKILTLEGLEKYIYGDDPIKFVQKFLRAIYKHPKYTSKESIYETLMSLLDCDMTRYFKNKGSQDPDPVIERFIIERSSWSHLARNVVEVQKRLKLRYVYSSIMKEMKFFREACDLMAAHPKIRPLELLTVLSPKRARDFDINYRSERYNPEFDIETTIRRFVDREVSVRYMWLMQTDYDYELIQKISEIPEDKLLQSYSRRDYIDVSLEDLVKLVKNEETEPKKNEAEDKRKEKKMRRRPPSEHSI
ncbi:hypothetical protein DAKH74_011970 [Maudiozyma humilis]|uniref:Uncharacterized protein n=1 Tax=Maudiozyma humilis TaxID=51915 RepID=A0AAV5RVB5_MAUHU|nr:hypothetical protein DAKH74_011970 [Kazachstania humilis]